MDIIVLQERHTLNIVLKIILLLWWWTWKEDTCQLSKTEELKRMGALQNIHVFFLYSVFPSRSSQYPSLPTCLGPYPFHLLRICTGLQVFAYSFSVKQLKAAVSGCRQTGSARNNPPGSSFPNTRNASGPFTVCQSFLHRIKLQVPTVRLLAHLFWLLFLFLTSPFPYRCCTIHINYLHQL